MPRELRFTNCELRAEGSRKIAGYAAVFHQWSEELGGFREQIAPGAFTRTLRERDDVLGLFNHDKNLLLGRSGSGTLKLWEDPMGLGFEIGLPDTQLGRDVRELVERGDLRGCSFSFHARADDWQANRTKRTLLDVKLFDVGPVSEPAYPQTSVAARSVKQGECIGVYRFEPRSPASRLYTPIQELDGAQESRRRLDMLRLDRLEAGNAD